MAQASDTTPFADPASEAVFVSQVRRNPANLQFITDALPVLVSYVGTDQRYRFVNRAYERWFGLSRAEIVGSHVEQVLGTAAYAELRSQMEAALRGREVNLRSKIAYARGGVRFVNARYLPDVAPDGSVLGFVALVSDISEEERAKELREAAALRTERLMKVTAAMAEAVDTTQVLEALVDRVAEALGASSLGLWLLSADGSVAELARSVGYSANARAGISRVRVEGSPQPFPVTDALARRQPLWIRSQGELLEQYPHLAAIVSPERAYSVACLPLVVRGEPRGCLGFTFDDERVADKDERDFLQLVARYSGQALERVRLLETERTSRAEAEAAAVRLALLSRASRVFALESRHLTQLFQAIAAQVTSEYADGCYVALVSEHGDVLEPAAVHHRVPAVAALLGAALEAAPPRASVGLLGRVVSSGDAVLLPVIDATAFRDAPAPHQQWLSGHPPRSLVIVPLRVGGRVVGALAAMRHDAARPFSPEDQRLLEELADRASVAIEAARLHEANEQGRTRAELLYELAAAVIRAGSVDEVFDGALDGIERALGASRCSILTFDNEGVMRFRAFRGLSDEYRKAVEGHSPWPRQATHPEPIVVPDVYADEGLSAYRSLFEREGIGALGFIPLVWNGALIGKFMVYYPEPRSLSDAELDMARAIANHIAAAIGRFTVLAELQQTVRFNEIFTGMLGHDLRNPLGAIMAGVHIAMRRAEGEQLMKPLLRISSSGARMARMIDQLLDFTRVRVGDGFPLDRRETDLVPLLRQVIDELTDAYPTHQFRLEGVDGDTRGNWDGDRISQVFSNLVANAVQHGARERGVAVRIDGNQLDAVCVHVENGGSVPAKVLPSMFEPMAGGDRRGEKSEGLGLGLYISREIVRAHGGSIDVTTSEAGTTFSVRLPRARAGELARERPPV